jgi:hypothetical protein
VTACVFRCLNSQLAQQSYDGGSSGGGGGGGGDDDEDEMRIR